MVLALGGVGSRCSWVRPGNEASVTLVKTATKTEIPRVGLWPEGNSQREQGAGDDQASGRKKGETGTEKRTRSLCHQSRRDPWRESATQVPPVTDRSLDSELLSR